MINVRANHILNLSGAYADPATTPITIDSGWNWISYLPPFSLPLQSALAGINAQAGDLITGQTGYAMFTGTNWIGTLTFMQEGRGYMYHSNNTIPQTLIYPTENSQLFRVPIFTESAVTPRWTVDPSRFASSMTMTSIVVKSGEEMRSDQIEIGAFSGNDVRGSVVLQYEESIDRYIGFLMVYGEGNEEIRLKVFDHITETEHNANNDPVRFTAEAIFGIPDFYPVSIGESTGNVETHCNASVQPQAYPNPFTDVLRIAKAEGYMLHVLNPNGIVVHTQRINSPIESINLQHLSAGAYVLRLEKDGQIRTITVVKQ